MRVKSWSTVLLVVAAACGDDGGGDLVPDAPVAVNHPELDLPMRTQIQMMEAKQLASADLTAWYLERIRDRDAPMTGTHAFLRLDPMAGATASTVDAQRGTGKLLQGAVLAIKDNIDTAGLVTTGGSIALAQNVPTTDATVIAKVRAANAVIVGKANLSEWANFRGYRSTSGWSSAGGQTRHGRVSGYNPCGSSSGSAASVANGTSSASLGTETNGSIVCPAAIHSLVGFKPTVGLVSRAGVIPISHTQDTVGPITRDVGDAARLLSVIAGPDAKDPATAAIPTSLSLDFEAPLATATLAGKRIGVIRSFGSFGADIDTVFAAELTRMSGAGAVLVDVTLPDNTFNNDGFEVLLYEFKAGINAYLASHARAGQPGSLSELIAYNTANMPVVLAYFGQEILVEAQMRGDLDTPAYLAAKQRVRTAAADNGITAALAADNLDVLVSPTMSAPWMTNYVTGDQFGNGSSPYPAAAGFPHLTVPMRPGSATPAGLSIMGGQWDDAEVLAIGYAYERLRAMSP